MSFLYKASTSAFRVGRLAPRAAFSTSVRSQKSAIDVAKGALKEVDRTVADAAVKGIEKGGKYTTFAVTKLSLELRCSPSSLANTDLTIVFYVGI